VGAPALSPPRVPARSHAWRARCATVRPTQVPPKVIGTDKNRHVVFDLGAVLAEVLAVHPVDLSAHRGPEPPPVVHGVCQSRRVVQERRRLRWKGIFIVIQLWGDDIDPANTIHHRNGCWVLLIRIVGPNSSKVYIRVLAIGSKGGLHDAVLKIVMERIREINANGGVVFYGPSHTPIRVKVTVHR
jgi:hypothetical protein